MGIDLDALVNGPCVETFGVAATGGGKATYLPRTGGSFDIDGIFDKAWSNVSLTVGRHGQPISSTQPCFGVRASEFPDDVSPTQRSKLRLANGDTYEISDVQPDGFSYFYLLLTKV